MIFDYHGCDKSHGSREETKQVKAPTQHQFKVGDKVCILSDARYSNGNVVDGLGYASAIGCIGEVSMIIELDNTIMVKKIPPECGGEWFYKPNQLSPVRLSDYLRWLIECCNILGNNRRSQGENHMNQNTRPAVTPRGVKESLKKPQFKVGDKVRIISDAWLDITKKTTTVVSGSFQSAVGCIGTVEFVCTKYITVTTPSGCGGEWSYLPEQLALVVENIPKVEQAVTTAATPSTPPCEETLPELAAEDAVIQGNQSKMLGDSSYNSPNTAHGNPLLLTPAQCELVKQALQKRLDELELERVPLIELLAQLDSTGAE